jgi:RNA polymerase sigma factor FliA
MRAKSSDAVDEATDSLTDEQRRWVEHAAPRVALIARSLVHRIGHVAMDELMSAGYEGLVQAAQRYDPGTGVPFTAFAHYRVRGAMIDCARSHLPAVRRRNRALRTLEASQALLEQAQRGVIPATAADPRTLEERVAAAAELVARQTTAVLLSRAGAPDPDTVSADDMEANLLDAELREQLAKLLQTCSADERALIEAIYFQGRTMAAYAEQIGKSVSTVSRHHARLISRLGKVLRARLGAPLADPRDT